MWSWPLEAHFCWVLLSDAESRYAPVEGKALTLTYALKSCHMFVLGCPNLMLSVDHQPVVPIFSERALEKISNLRLFNLKGRSLRYRFTIKHTPGKSHVGPNATSRYPSASPFMPSLIPAILSAGQPLLTSMIASSHPG